MATGNTAQEQLRADLSAVQEELAQARATRDAVRRGLGGSGDGPTDAAEGAADLTAALEQQALVEALESRELRLREKLGLPPE
jgi:hypothetical protein